MATPLPVRASYVVHLAHRPLVSCAASSSGYGGCTMVRGAGVCVEVVLRAVGQYEWKAASSPGDPGAKDERSPTHPPVASNGDPADVNVTATTATVTSSSCHACMACLLLSELSVVYGSTRTASSPWCGASHAHREPRSPRRGKCSSLRIAARLMGDEEMDTRGSVTLPNDSASSHCHPAGLAGLMPFVDPRGRRRRATEAETGCSDAERFELELEFVQCLANPKYLNCAHCPARSQTLRLPAAAIAQVVEHAINPAWSTLPRRAQAASGMKSGMQTTKCVIGTSRT
jgi:hypothetical protein